ncbi:MAG: insulinase family protein [Gemmatimonadetes bacterium]|nr:insulinase family protein [Gemmatimonadota bacterium]MBK7715502.1 insulinase family protein [Gemmatimonadota bacterium]MBK7923210.1 insulinase family protein [Gemmatimonadota bacterium]MBK9693280.1 insulinase family protein [Gemmatimonadota bacterium]
MLLRPPARVLLLAALLAPPAAAQAPALRVPVTVDTLPNGLTVIVHEDHSVPTVAVNVWYHVGSGDEKAGRTGFAHLFEHLMFMGSQNAEYPAFDRLLEGAGANNNGSTTEDRTNYYEWGPATALPLMLWLEADRMGWLLPTMTGEKVDLQRDVVKNERRQSNENQPYGLANETILALLYPAGHPYSWPVIGSMADLSAASVEDVKDFFRRYYAPNNASLVVAGDVQPAEVLRLARQYFSEIPRGPAIERTTAAAVALPRDTAAVLEDRVQLARLYYVWPTVPGLTPDDAPLELLAYLLAGEKNSRLTEALVHDDQTASSVWAYQDGKRVGGDFWVVATAKPEQALTGLQPTIDRELRRLAAEGPTARELEQAINALEASFLRRIETVNGKADMLNGYFVRTGHADGFAADLARYRAITAADIQRVATRYLTQPRVTLSVVPQGKPELAATPVKGTP